MSEQPKNIILCADGTGNRGGETPDTNVYRMYQAVDLHQPERKREQITFYDNGVGTSSNKYIKAITGGLGFGFRKNVCDLYEFLALNYNHGDLVYLFGFSRGAATVRAFGGMLQECGLIDRTHQTCLTDGKFDYEKFVLQIKKAFQHYKTKQGQQLKKTIGVKEVRIKFLGIWDTVSALGFPYHRSSDSWAGDLQERPLLVWLLRAIDEFFDFGPFAHKFYNYTPNEIVDHVYHAIAIDDERKSFLPRIWDETYLKGKISQVWFAGMHADVGGGYYQTELAYVTMLWMMERAEHHGLDLLEGALQDAKEKSNIHGKLHNSREGLKIYYRYAARDIEELCTRYDEGGDRKINGPIQIHQSVIDRMDQATDRYTPGLLPAEFAIVGTHIPEKNNKLVTYGEGSTVDPHVVDATALVESKNEVTDWQQDKKKVKTTVTLRRLLYRIFADYSLLIALTVFYLWIRSGRTIDRLILPFDNTNLWKFGFQSIPCLKDLGEVLQYFLPRIFDPFIQEFVVHRPLIFVLIIAIFCALIIIRTRLKKATVKASVKICEKIDFKMRSIKQEAV